MQDSMPISLNICQRHPLEETFGMTPQWSQMNYSVAHEIHRQNLANDSSISFRPYTPNYHKLRTPLKPISISIGVKVFSKIDALEREKILRTDPSTTLNRVFRRWDTAGQCKNKCEAFSELNLHITQKSGDKAASGLLIWSMSLVLVQLRTANKRFTLEGPMDFQIGLSNRKDFLIGDEVRNWI